MIGRKRKVKRIKYENIVSQKQNGIIYFREGKRVFSARIKNPHHPVGKTIHPTRGKIIYEDTIKELSILNKAIQ